MMPLDQPVLSVGGAAHLNGGFGRIVPAVGGRERWFRGQQKCRTGSQLREIKRWCRIGGGANPEKASEFVVWKLEINVRSPPIDDLE
jgi:hypothetical protein